MKKVISFVISELGRIIVGLVLFSMALAVEYYDRDTSFSLRALILYVVALCVAGAPVFIDAVRGIFRRDLLDEKFLMSIAAIGAMIVGEWREGVAVMIFFLVGEYFEHKAVSRARKSINSLMDIRPDEASVLIDGVETVMDADDVAVGSRIVIRAGERVPIDSVVTDGSADVDTSALTGESMPFAVLPGSSLDSGAVVMNGVLTARTVRSADSSAAARILDLVENANERKSKTESFITKFSHYYTPCVVALALLLAFIPPIFDWMTINDSVYRALTFLVVSCPCALVISIPMAFFGGIGGAASRGILFKGGSTFSALACADSFAFDKTGTLTGGSFEIKGVYPIAIDEDRLLYYAASAESASNHPIAQCISRSCKRVSKPERATEIAGKGISAVIDGSAVLVGNVALCADHGVNVGSSHFPIGTVFVCIDGKLCGYIVISDRVRDEARGTVAELRKLGARRIVMLSGDKSERAEEIGCALNMDEIYSELLPDDKYRKLENIIQSSHSTVYVGDGINDAPSIALADVGIAMGGIGQDSAIEAADVVIMSDDLSRLPLAVRVARRTLRISRENIVLALGVKAAVLLLGAVGLANMWLAVFADVGVAALAILNSMRTLRIGRR